VRVDPCSHPITESHDDYSWLMRAWLALGVPAFGSILVLLYLMLSKTVAPVQLFDWRY